MKHYSTIHTATSMLLIILFLSSSTLLPAQQSEEAKQALAKQAIADAKRDVENNINKPMWFALGCFLGTGLVMSYMTTPTVPAGNLLGKDPVYVAFYTDTYVVELKKAQTQAALGGCIILGAGWCLLSIVSVGLTQ